MEELELIPVRTRILTDSDDIVDVMERYAKEQIGPNDVITVAESVVAITQGRMTRPEELKPCFLARVLCRFIPQEGSMSSVYGMQAVMDVEGKYRVLFAMIIGILGKMIGKSGVFYNMAGRQAALVDDVTGTMPPFDKSIVYGPADADQVAQKIKDRLGCYGAAVADVNDLKRSLIVGTSQGVTADKLAKILIDNPFGNASQKTPIVIIKNYAQAADKI
ncbi:MAG: coenzyme F420-0:L-glutamate ligase [Sporomusaceae bacterium]|nr:coenzyme F420-0:L-glutamate ligase [Sporomusaceae bacterium]